MSLPIKLIAPNRVIDPNRVRLPNSETVCPVCDRKRCGCLEGGVFVAAVSDLDKKELRNERQGLTFERQGKTRAVPMLRARAVLPT